MKKALLLNLLVLAGIFAFGQINSGNKYFIEFTDKDNSPYSIENPEAYLSERAIERRERYNIPIDTFDIPVNPQYIQAVADVGVEVSNPSKWLNGIVVKTSDPSKITEIEALAFVKSTVKNIAPASAAVATYDEASISLNKPFGKNEKLEASTPDFKSQKGTSSLNYGQAYNQIDMLGGIALHDAGYQGQGMVIAVLDGGFASTNNMAAFDSLYMNGRILSAWDFVDSDDNPYHGSTHGTSVLSTMGANLPGQIVGTAPEASYHLLRTEDTGSEYLIEEYNWVSGAEYADSAGADVINSSLSYKTFDNPAQDHTYQDMDGNTAPCTIGADRCMSRGMIVVNSAGNEGNDPYWPYIGSPGDGDSVFTIGAVNSQGEYVSFSSIGPTADGRLKPEVVAQGSATVIATTNGGVGTASGTSFSSPITAGMTTCLWQFDPSMTNMEVLSAIKESGNMASNPDFEMGYGLPDYALASLILSGFNSDNEVKPNEIDVFPNPFQDQIKMVFNSQDTQSIIINISDITGRLVYSSDKIYRSRGINFFKIDDLAHLNEGIYIINILSDGYIASKKIMKVKN